MMKRDRTAGAVTAVAAAATLLAVTNVPAGAASQNAEYTLTEGQVMLGTTPYELPAATGIVGTWDDETGAFDGVFTSEAVSATQVVTDPVQGTISVAYQFVADTNVTGTIDPVTGDGTLSTTIDVVITFGQLVLDSNPGSPIALGQVCTIADVPMSFTATGSGGQSPVFEFLALTASGFAAPAGTCTGGNEALTPTIQTQLNTTIGLPTQQTSADLRFEAGQIPPPSTTTTTVPPSTTATTAAPTTTTAPAPAPGAAAVTTRANYTG